VENDAPTPPADPGLRRMLRWVAIALVASVIFAVIAVWLTIRVFR
jgi:hypothetical protein